MFLQKSGVCVKSHCTPDKGVKGYTPVKKSVLSKLKASEFVKYSYSTKLSASKRLSKLKGDCKDLTYVSILKRFVVLRSYNKRNPKLYAKFNHDIKALQKLKKVSKVKKVSRYNIIKKLIIKKLIIKKLIYDYKI